MANERDMGMPPQGVPRSSAGRMASRQGNIFDWMETPMFLGQTPNDLIWWSILILSGVDLIGKFSNNNFAAAIGIGGGLSDMQMAALDCVVFVRAAVQVWAEQPAVKITATAISEVVGLVVLLAVMSGYKSVNEMTAAVGSNINLPTFTYPVNVAQAPAIVTKYDMAKCTFNNPKLGRALTQPEKEWCIDTNKAAGLTATEAKACGC